MKINEVTEGQRVTHVRDGAGTIINADGVKFRGTVRIAFDSGITAGRWVADLETAE